MSKLPRNSDQRPDPEPDASANGILGFPLLARWMPWRARPPARPDRAAPAEPAVAWPPEASPAAAPALTPSEQQFLLHLARGALQRAAADGAELPEATLEECPERLRLPGACFVTLTHKGELRGCVGSLLAQQPLCQAVATSARNAARRDPRFPPVSAGELEHVRLEVSVLGEPVPLSYTSPEQLLALLRPGEHGVVLRVGSRVATFLPKVWEQLQDKAEFLDRLAGKLGCAPSAWRGEDVSVSVYRVESFLEG